jgi:hypothetical protein
MHTEEDNNSDVTHVHGTKKAITIEPIIQIKSRLHHYLIITLDYVCTIFFKSILFNTN